MMARAICSFLLVALVNAAGYTQVVGERILSDIFYRADQLIDVQIRLDGNTPPVTVVEQPPTGWTIVSAYGDREIEDGVITWNSGAGPFRYRVRAPSVLGDRVSFTGTVDGTPITGMTEMAPIQLQGGEPFLYDITVSDGYYAMDREWPLLLVVQRPSGPEPQTPLTQTDFLRIDPKTWPPGVPANDPDSVPITVDRLKYTLDEIFANYNVDLSRVYLSGLSKGGVMTGLFAMNYPELLTAIVPMASSGIAGFGSRLDVDRLVNVPI